MKVDKVKRSKVKYGFRRSWLGAKVIVQDDISESEDKKLNLPKALGWSHKNTGHRSQSKDLKTVWFWHSGVTLKESFYILSRRVSQPVLVVQLTFPVGLTLNQGKLIVKLIFSGGRICPLVTNIKISLTSFNFIWGCNSFRSKTIFYLL